MQNFEVNPNKEYILCGDISASMQTVDQKCADNSRYKYMLEKFKSFIKASEDFDPHGASIILFGEKTHNYPDTTLEKLEKDRILDKIDFEGFTNIHLAIDDAYKIHKEKKSEFANEGKVHPGTICMIFTDGDPTNRLAVERTIIQIANEIDREEEFQIVFLTVGTISHELKSYLDGLHDTLEKKLTKDYDIFHVLELDKTSFLSVAAANQH